MPRKAAVDFGLKRIGLAISDEKARVALPLKMVRAGKSLKETARIVLTALSPYEGQIDTIIVGLPLLLSGKRGDMADAADRFADALQKETKMKIQMMDERLSTAQADRALKELDYSRKDRSQIIDSASATLLLQTFLDQANEPS
jgi:putative holliday junction resolvase